MVVFDKIYIGEVLKLNRKKKKLTIFQLAELMDISNQMIYEYEKGRKMPNAENLLKLMYLYNLSVNDFINNQ